MNHLGVILINTILISMGLFTLLKWLSWNIIEKTKIVETIGNFLTRSNDDKSYYFSSCNRVFNVVKCVMIILWIAVPVILLFMFGMKTIV